MGERNILDRLLEVQNGYIRLVDAQNEGVSKHSVLDYVRKNEMEKIAPGIYISPDAWE
ncbi:MAG: type IV toxin-antitoxin system AbiEi family antitoxin domain-containing protein, partial [Lachnoanaerobaculum gingivalis]